MTRGGFGMAIDYEGIRETLTTAKGIVRNMGYVKGAVPKTVVSYDRVRNFLGAVEQYAMIKSDLSVATPAQQKTAEYKAASAELKEFGGELRSAGKNMMQLTASGVSGYVYGLKDQAEDGRKFLGIIPVSSTIGYALDDGKDAIKRARVDIGTIKDVLDTAGVLTDQDKKYVGILTERLGRAETSLKTSGSRYKQNADRKAAEKDRKKLEKDLSRFESRMRSLGI
jgi:hypothetical protein